ncbi:Putative IAP [Invertebrate iridescent virus 22]|uniref:IAP n=1 Tax=Invertebrate iridescent virus 22 TaxID=345198 RepID=S6DDR1_9VIRU|nr:Putative IAP [Invertebrate iridescent virus 22]CCV01769.1 Putative IAP [Invertebrate iridescent virus 22]
MEESILQTHDKTTLKNIAFDKGLTRRGFNGRNASRMRKQDFIDFILYTQQRETSPSLEDEVVNLFQELIMDDEFRPMVHIMGILNGIHTLQLRTSNGDVRVFERSISDNDSNKDERVPNEEDEVVPNLELKNLIDNTHDIDCKCEECEKNDNIKKENLKVQMNVKDLENKITCVVCQTNTRNVIFGPCNHLATCISCSKNPLLKKCPLCRTVFETKTRVFC